MTTRYSNEKTWINKFSCSDGGNFADIATERKYQIDNGKLGVFWVRFCEMKVRGEDHSVGEILGPCPALMVSIRLHYIPRPDMLIPLSFTKPAIFCLQKVVKSLLSIDNDERLLCAVIEGNPIGEKDATAYLNLHFPLIALKVKDQKEIIVPEFIAEIKAQNIRSQLEMDPEILTVETSAYDVAYPIVGSVNVKKRVRYDFAGFYPYLTENDLRRETSEVVMEEIFNPIVQCSFVIQGSIKPQLFTEPDKVIQRSRPNSRNSSVIPDDEGINTYFWLPFFLSINYPIYQPNVRKQEMTRLSSEPSAVPTTAIDLEIKVLQWVIDSIHFNFRSSHPYKNKIGKIIYNIYSGSDIGYEYWMLITTQRDPPKEKLESINQSQEEEIDSISPDYYQFGEDENEDVDSLLQLREGDVPGIRIDLDLNENQKIWRSFGSNNENYSIKTLHYIASHQHLKGGPDKKEYKECVDKYWRSFYQEYDQTFADASSQLEGKVADLFHAYFPYRFIWNSNDTEWYYFDQHRWLLDKNGDEVISYLSNEFVAQINRQLLNFAGEATLEPERERADANRDLVEGMRNLKMKLLKINFKRNVFAELKQKYRFRVFNVIRDENPNLLVCRNCILEIVDGKIYDRDGLPEDYCTLSTKINYLPKRKTDPYRRSMVRTYFNQIYSQHDVRNWMWLYWVSCLRGGTPDKNFVFLQGRGDDSKSIMIKLLGYTYGDYLIIGKNENILAGVKMSSSGPEPEKIRERGRHIVVYQELDSRTPLDGSKVRVKSGGDNVGGVRDAFKGSDSMVEFKQMAKNVGTFNREMVWAEGATIDATWRRVKSVPHGSRWRENAPDTFEEQWRTKVFKMDENFGDVLPQLAETFLSMLVETWSQYHARRLPKSPTIEKATSDWRRNCDLYHLYSEDRLDFHRLENGLPDPAYQKSIPQLYQDFTNWFRINFSGSKVPNRPRFEEEMLIKIQAVERKFIGISLKAVGPQNRNEEEEEEE